MPGVVGFTGSRLGVSGPQLMWLREQVAGEKVLHHGACVGADTAAHRVAVEAGLRVVIHPPVDESRMTPVDVLRGKDVLWLPAQVYLTRNRDIVDACDRLIALPAGKQEMRGGGTWSTVRYALKVGKPVLICYPDGRVVG